MPASLAHLASKLNVTATAGKNCSGHAMAEGVQKKSAPWNRDHTYGEREKALVAMQMCSCAHQMVHHC